MPFGANPGAFVVIALVAALYVRAVRVLRARGYDVPLGQRAAWYGGIALTAAALLSPIDMWSEDILTAHMAQHLLIADLAAPLLLVGIRTPVLVFLLPRRLLVPLARRRRLRAAFRWVRQPLAAIPIFVVVLYAWHVPTLFEGALRSDLVHSVQHQSFVVISILVWWSAIEPKRRRLRGELWKIGHILGARLGSMMLGMAFIVMRAPLYVDFYGDRGLPYNLTGLQDQQIAGGLMLTFDTAVMLWALAFFFWRSAQDHDIAEARQAQRA